MLSPPYEAKSNPITWVHRKQKTAPTRRNPGSHVFRSKNFGLTTDPCNKVVNRLKNGCRYGVLPLCLAGGRLQARNRCHQCPYALIAALQNNQASATERYACPQRGVALAPACN